MDVELPAFLRRWRNDVHGTVAAEKVGHGTERPHSSRQPNALELARDKAETLQGQRQVHAAFGASQGMDFIDDDGVHGLEDPGRLGGEHEVGRLRRGDEDVRRLAHLAGALCLRGIAGAHAHGDVRHVEPQALSSARDAIERGTQVVLHVHAQGLEWGNVEHPYAVVGALAGRFIAQRQGGLSFALHQGIQRPQKSRECLTRTSRGHHEGVGSLGDSLPCLFLNGGRSSENVLEPAGDLRAKLSENVFGHALL